MSTETNATRAAELRAAASKIRDLSAPMPPCDWRADGVEVTSDFFFVAEIRHIDREKAGNAAQYFASWHPVVAIAIADWLETEAKAWDATLVAFPGLDPNPEDLLRWPLRIAREINGGAR